MDETEDVPLVYVASRLTGLTPKQRALLDEDCAVIQRAVVDAALEAQPSWEVRVYTPLSFTAPWRNNDSARTIWRRNLEKVLVHADALIVHGMASASFGVGNEATLAYSRGIPILYVHDELDPVSRQTVGMAIHSSGMGIEKFTGHDELQHAVWNWVEENRSDIESGPEMRADLARLWSALHQDLRSAFIDHRESGSDVIAEVAFLASMPPSEIDFVLSHPLLLSALSGQKLVRLSAALEVSIGAHFAALRRPPPLAPRQRRALNQLRESESLGDSFVEVLTNAAEAWLDREQRNSERLSMSSSPARRRTMFDLEDPHGWEEFYLAWRGGHLD